MKTIIINKKIKKLITKSLTLLLLISLFTPLLLPSFAKDEDEKTRTIAVLSFASKEETLAKWKPLAEYLSAEVDGHSFRIKAIFYTEFDDAINNKEIDYILTNPAHYIALGQKFELSGAIASLIELSDGKAQYGFGGVIFTKNKEGQAKHIGDLRGKTISAVSKSSLGGFQASAYELKKWGYNIERDVNINLTGMPHSNTISAVMAGEADVGFVRSGVIESLIRLGKLAEDDLTIINEQDIDSFEQRLSTPLYPEWPFISLDHIEKNEAQRVAASLFLMHEYSEYSDQIGIYGFTIPSSYVEVEVLMRSLKIAPFDYEEAISLDRIWSQYSFELTISILLISIVVWYALYKTRVGKLLTNKNRELKVLTDKLQNLNYELTEISIKDSLTGLYNRRYFENFLEERLDDVEKEDKDIAICVIDIDDFKYYNDNFGHNVGDQVLVEVANELNSQITMQRDIVARYAGDEFIIVLYDISGRNLDDIAKKIMDSINDIRLSVSESNKPLKVSISMGVTTAQKACNQTSRRIFNTADRALYAAKEKGKNTCVIERCTCRHCD